jgi:hypothetical protein
MLCSLLSVRAGDMSPRMEVEVIEDGAESEERKNELRSAMFND